METSAKAMNRAWHPLPTAKIPTTIIHKCSEGVVSAHQLLQWITTAPCIIKPFGLNKSMLELLGLYKFEIEAFSEPLGRKFLGIGRHRDEKIAASISAGEAIEALVAFEALFQKRSSSTLLKINSECLSISECAEKPFPIDHLHSSNGWAVHFDLSTAIQTAVKEAMERSILLYGFLKDGWQGFQLINQSELQGRKIDSLISRYSFGGYSAGMALVHSNTFPGFCIGYCSDFSSKIQQSPKWQQALLEAFEPLCFYEEHGARENARLREFGYSWFQKPQLHYLKHKEPLNFDEGTHLLPILDEVNARLACFDIAEVLGMPFPFYAAFVYGEDILPLFITERLTPSEVSDLETTFKRWNFHQSLPTTHPVY